MHPESCDCTSITVNVILDALDSSEEPHPLVLNRRVHCPNGLFFLPPMDLRAIPETSLLQFNGEELVRYTHAKASIDRTTDVFELLLFTGCCALAQRLLL